MPISHRSIARSATPKPQSSVAREPVMDDYGLDDVMDRHTSQASPTLDQIARYILANPGSPPGIIILAGAGISTSAGIPDFRSPKTGLYDNLARFSLDSPTDVFDINFFRTNPQPFYSLAPELYPGRYAPTISHAFVALLARKGLLAMLFTQNIDGLEKAAGVPPDLVVEAHGSFDSQRCIDCAQEFPAADMRAHVATSSVPHCGKCGGLVKPDIVFFGEQLPDRFFRAREAHLPDLEGAPIPEILGGARQVVIVMGTSLSVPPFCELPVRAADGVPRLLFNREVVGDFGERAQDVVELGDCDSGVRKLAEMLGWGEELEVEWRRVVGNEEAERQLVRAAAAAAPHPILEMDDGLSEDSSDTSDSASDKDDLMSDDGGNTDHEVNDFSSSSFGAVATPLTLDSVYYNPHQDQMVHISSSLPSVSLAADLACLVPPVEGDFVGSFDHHNFLIDPIDTRQGQSTGYLDHSHAMLDLVPLPHGHGESGSVDDERGNQNLEDGVRNHDIDGPNDTNEGAKTTRTFQLTDSRVQTEGNVSPDPISMFTWHDDPGFWGEWPGPADS